MASRAVDTKEMKIRLHILFFFIIVYLLSPLLFSQFAKGENRCKGHNVKKKAVTGKPHFKHSGWILPCKSQNDSWLGIQGSTLST